MLLSVAGDRISIFISIPGSGASVEGSTEGASVDGSTEGDSDGASVEGVDLAGSSTEPRAISSFEELKATIINVYAVFSSNSVLSFICAELSTQVSDDPIPLF